MSEDNLPNDNIIGGRSQETLSHFKLGNQYRTSLPRLAVVFIIALCCQTSTVVAWLEADELESVQKQILAALEPVQPVRRSSHGRRSELSQDAAESLSSVDYHQGTETNKFRTTDSTKPELVADSELRDTSRGQVFAQNFTHFARSGKKLHFAYQANVSEAVHSLDFERISVLKSVQCQFSPEGYNVLHLRVNLTAAALMPQPANGDDRSHTFPSLSYIRAGTILVASSTNSTRWGCSLGAKKLGENKRDSIKLESAAPLREIIVGCALPGYEMSSPFLSEHVRRSESAYDIPESKSFITEGCYRANTLHSSKIFSVPESSKSRPVSSTEGVEGAQKRERRILEVPDIVTVVVLTKTVDAQEVFHEMRVRYFIGNVEKDVDSVVNALYSRQTNTSTDEPSERNQHGKGSIGSTPITSKGDIHFQSTGNSATTNEEGASEASRKLLDWELRQVADASKLKNISADADKAVEVVAIESFGGPNAPTAAAQYLSVAAAHRELCMVRPAPLATPATIFLLGHAMTADKTRTARQISIVAGIPGTAQAAAVP
ncbi:hypothetical protein CYMTET_11834 [Cymbomonas tetramitiformis]|uniref:Uncharacterized protein n=1 Tax=Cymbomonas tetramitiformis TaxID=36881 RepID=A0AAE0LCG3_9CHLO|nr:hypothetical protein CYMTET_11834 [Cymbomonas tetramitiformis]